METEKAIANFPVSGEPIPTPVARWLGRIKAAAARVNADLGLLDRDLAERIAAAGDRVAEGEFDDQFPIDVFQTGSGTSSNMNANEVIATLAGDDVHPNDHVNMGQSSNDVFPSAVHLAALGEIANDLLPALALLAESLERKAAEFDDVVKSGRTHLMDAVPVTLGQEFGGYAAQVRQGIARVEDAMPRLGQIPLGGTATGTGLNTHPEFAARVRDLLVGRHRPHDLRARRPLRGAGGARRPRRGLGRAQGRRRLAHEDRERPPADGLRAARGPVRDLPARAPEGQLDHARQGQPGHPRGRDAGRRPGDRQRHRDHRRRHGRPLRAQRLHPADGAQPPAVDRAARERVTAARREVRRRDRGEPRAQRAVRREHALGRDRAQPLHRLRQGVGDREGGERVRASVCARSRAKPASTKRPSTRRSTTTAWRSRTADAISATVSAS